VVQALLDVLGSAGHLMVPTYTYWSSRFDPLHEPSQTGRITEAVRCWPGAVRSLHPTHSVAVIGPEAEALVAGHHLMSAIAVDSPLGRLAQRGGKVLLLGCGHNQNSMIHVGEMAANVPYQDVPFAPDSQRAATVVTAAGEIPAPILAPSGCSKGFGAIEWHLRQRGAIRDGLVGSSLAQFMPGAAVVDATAALLWEEPAALLCSDPHCYRCTTARLVIEERAHA
jgi:aminoglycoside 3-N-acetyltransferase